MIAPTHILKGDVPPEWLVIYRIVLEAWEIMMPLLLIPISQNYFVLLLDNLAGKNCINPLLNP